MLIFDYKLARQRLPHLEQRGFTLVELAVVLTVVAVLAGAVVPGINGFIIEKELSSAQTRIAVTVNRAKSIAETQGTTVDLELTADGQLIMDIGNTATDKTITLENVTLTTTSADDNTYRFSPMGTVNNSGTEGVIVITSNKNTKKTKTVSIATQTGQLILN